MVIWLLVLLCLIMGAFATIIVARSPHAQEKPEGLLAILACLILILVLLTQV